MTYEIVLRLGDTQLDVAYVTDAYRIAGVELVRGGKPVAERGRIGLVDFTVTRTTPLERSLPYTRGDDRKVIPYLGVALAAHLLVWGFATHARPVHERHVVQKRERPVHIAKITDAMTLPDEIRDDESPDTKAPGQGVPMGLAAGASGADDAESESGHITVANIDDSPRASRAEVMNEVRTAGMLGAITTGHIKKLTGDADLTSAFDDVSTNGALYGGKEASEGTFGYGRSGFDPGGGGNTYGTIGVSYTGHWSNGTSPGRGWGGSFPGGESIPRPPVRFGVTIDICGRPYENDCMLHGANADASIIKRYVKRRMHQISFCWEKRWLAEPNISRGPLRVDFTIGDDGKVTKISTGGIDAEVERCVADVYKDIDFPKRGLQVRHILVYSKSTHN